jgi:nitroimidazol reductase NimA-like FMN-containing flavoprotein (pyridoxamine 5'-phosphate oxidase superfamily)
MSREDCMEVLLESRECAFATVGEDGAPYVTTLNFAVAGTVIYVHGAREGTRNRNIMRDPRVSLCAFTGGEIGRGEGPCNTGTRFSSVVVSGKARIVEDDAERSLALDALVAKYAPEHAGKPMPVKAAAATGVVAVEPAAMTGRRR